MADEYLSQNALRLLQELTPQRGTPKKKPLSHSAQELIGSLEIKHELALEDKDLVLEVRESGFEASVVSGRKVG